MRTIFKKNKKLLITICSIYIIFGSVSIYQGIALGDEKNFHLPLLQRMNNEGFLDTVLGEKYSAANTPLPYLLVLTFCKIFSVTPNLYIVRTINIIISFITSLIFFYLLNIVYKIIDFRILIFIFYPYFLKTSFLYLITVYSVFFLLLALLIIYRNYKSSPLLSGLSTTFGIMSQQFLIVFPVAFTLHKLLGKWKSVRISTRIKEILLFSLPLILPAILFLLWGGLTHKNFRAHSISFQATHLTAISVIIGIAFFPFIIANYKSLLNRYSYLIILTALILGIFFLPEWQVRGGSGQITGLTFHLIVLSDRILPGMYNILVPLGVFSGVSTLIIIFMKLDNDFDKLIFISIIIFILSYMFNVLLSERHLLPLFSLLYLLILPSMKKGFLLNTWIILQIIGGTIFLYYSLFIHPIFS